MGMSFQITTAFVKQYQANVDILSQQMGTKLQMCVRNETQTGEHSFFDQVNSTAARKRTTRHADTPLISTPHARRRVTLVDFDWADLIDDLDKVKMLADPASTYALNAAYAFGRAKDDEIITAALGTANTGVDGSTSTVFDTTNNQIAAGGTGLDVAKVIEAKEILDGHEVDESITRYMAVTSKQISDLLALEKVTSSDYVSIQALVRGEIDTWMGFKFIRIERLGVDGSDDRRCIAWAEDGLLLSIGEDEKGPRARISERDDKNYAVQVYNSMSIGATRMEEKKVVEILCVES